VDLLEVAAEFHQEEVLVWLLRDATVFERELLGVLALERKLADSLVVALENGFQPWWGRTRGISWKWRASAGMELVPAPEGFSSECGWWTDLSSVTSALRGIGGVAGLGPMLPDGRPRDGSAVEFEWTKEMSRAQLGDANLVKSVVFPVGVTAIGEWGLLNFEAVESVAFPAGCINFGGQAVAGCRALRAISLPVGCKGTGESAFCGCSSLMSVTIPAGWSTISRACFQGCTSLMEVRFPEGLRLIGDCSFYQCALKEVALPDGCEVAQFAFCLCKALTTVIIGSGCRSIDKYALCECGALTSVTIGVGCTSIGRGAFQNCEALTTVTIEDGLKSIGGNAFGNCARLASVTLPSSVQSIGLCGFRNCTSLVAIAVPKSCELHYGAFWGCSPQVTRF
jgi:hypothetical protein